jgi:hypothetical protein
MLTRARHGTAAAAEAAAEVLQGLLRLLLLQDHILLVRSLQQLQQLQKRQQQVVATYRLQ